MNLDFLKHGQLRIALSEKQLTLKHFAKDNEQVKIFDHQLSREWLKTPEDNFAFVDTFWDKELQTLQEQVRNFFDQEGKLKALSQEEEELFKNYCDQLIKLKGELRNETAQIFKLSVTHAPIPALMNYLDQQRR